MRYDLPAGMQETEIPRWPVGAGSIPVRLPDGTPAALPVLKGVNVVTFGTVGTGKTKSFTLPAARILLQEDPRMLGVFFEIKRSFIDCFMQAGDKVFAHDPNTVSRDNLFVPNLILEIRQARDPEAEMMEFSEFLFADLLSGANQNRAWVESARNTFIGVLRVIVDCYPGESTTNRTLVNALRQMSVKDLMDYLAKHPRNRSVLEDWGYDPDRPQEYKPTRRAADIRFFLNQALQRFSGSFAMDGGDTIHDWLEGKYGRNLFFLYDLVSAQISRSFFLYYLKKIKDYKMSNTSRSLPPVLMVLDEIDKMADGGKAADWGLFQAANLGRECGLQILLTTQSMENLYGMAPEFNTHIAMGGLAGFPYLISFRTGDPTTISVLQTLYGSQYTRHVARPASRYGEPTVRSEWMPIVTDADLASLGTGSCIVKVLSHRPQEVYSHYG